MLLEHSANAEATDSEQATPLLIILRGLTPPAGRKDPRASFKNEPVDLGLWPGGLWPNEVHRLACAELLLKHGANIRRNVPESCLHIVTRLCGMDAGEPSKSQEPWPIPAKLLALRADPDSPDNDGRTPLELAVEYGAKDIIDLLFSLGVPLQLGPPLHAAVHRGNLSLAQQFIHGRADVNCTVGSERMSPLHLAALQSRPDVQTLLLESFADVRLVDTDGRTPLAVLAGAPLPEGIDREKDDKTRSDMVKELVRWGAELDSTGGPHGLTPLFSAARSQRPLVLGMLLSSKASLESTDAETGGGILHFAVGLGSGASNDMLRELIGELVRQSVKIDAVDNKRRTALHLAVRAGRADVLCTLKTKGADPAAKDVHGLTPLHVVAETNVNEDTARELMRWLVDPRLADPAKSVDRAGRTPLHHAAMRGHLAFATVLLQQRADPMRCDNVGATPLHLAAKAAFEAVQAAQTGPAEDVIEVLLKARASTMSKDDTGSTPLELAIGRAPGSTAQTDVPPDIAARLRELLKLRPS